MAAAVLALVAPGVTVSRSFDCVAQSFPDFAARLGDRVVSRAE